MKLFWHPPDLSTLHRINMSLHHLVVAKYINENLKIYWKWVQCSTVRFTQRGIRNKRASQMTCFEVSDGQLQDHTYGCVCTPIQKIKHTKHLTSIKFQCSKCNVSLCFHIYHKRVTSKSEFCYRTGRKTFLKCKCRTIRFINITLYFNSRVNYYFRKQWFLY